MSPYVSKRFALDSDPVTCSTSLEQAGWKGSSICLCIYMRQCARRNNEAALTMPVNSMGWALENWNTSCEDVLTVVSGTGMSSGLGDHRKNLASLLKLHFHLTSIDADLDLLYLAFVFVHWVMTALHSWCELGSHCCLSSTCLCSIPMSLGQELTRMH